MLDSGEELYRQRIQMIEPVAAHTQHKPLISRFHYRHRPAAIGAWTLPARRFIASEPWRNSDRNLAAESCDNIATRRSRPP